MLRASMSLLILVASCVWLPAKAHALDFRCPADPGFACRGEDIFLSGEIQPGDYELFKSEIKRLGPNPVTIVLWNSAGGDLKEAMKIGRLIFDLKFNTSVGQNDQSNGLVFFGPQFAPDGSWRPLLLRPSDAMCASACFFLWTAGISRRGDSMLVIHRPYFDPGHFAQLSADEAQGKYNEMEAAASSYLRDMGIPDQIWATMRTIPSHDGLVIQRDYIDANIPTSNPAFDEWLIAQCGGVTQEEEAVLKAELLATGTAQSTQGAATLNKMAVVGACRSGAQANAHKQAWNRMFGQ